MPSFQPRGRVAKTSRPILPLLALLLAILLTSVGSPAWAVDKFAAEFLKVGVGARAMGMGGSFVALANDATAAYWNPAGLILLESREAFGTHASQFGGVVAHDVLGVSAPMGNGSKRDAIGITLIRLAVDDIRVTKDAKIGEDPNGNPILDPSRIRTSSASTWRCSCPMPTASVTAGREA